MEKENPGLLEAYKEAEAIRGHTVQGLAGTIRGVRKLFVYLDEAGLPAVSVRFKEAMGYQGWLVEGDYSRSSVLYYLYSAGNFYDFLVRRGAVPDNPFDQVRKPRQEKKLPAHLLKEKQMGLFLEELSHFERGGKLVDRVRLYRAHVVAELLYATGLRASEASGLRIRDLDLSGGTVAVREGKGGQSRTAFMNDYAAKVLGLYVERMRGLVLNGQHAKSADLLFGVKWNSFSESMNHYYRSVGQRVGFTAVTCHKFRHALGYHLLRAGCSVRHIQDILGHRDLRSTELYTKVDKEDLRDVVDRFHPRRRFDEAG